MVRATKTLLVPVPEIEEQEEIAKSLAIIDNKAANARAKNANLQDIFRTFLHELMTTEIRAHSILLEERENDKVSSL